MAKIEWNFFFWKFILLNRFFFKLRSYQLLKLNSPSATLTLLNRFFFCILKVKLRQASLWSFMVSNLVINAVVFVRRLNLKPRASEEGVLIGRVNFLGVQGCLQKMFNINTPTFAIVEGLAGNILANSNSQCVWIILTDPFSWLSGGYFSLESQELLT